MAAAKKHHWVPQCYLKGFAMERKPDEYQVRVFDRVSGEKYPASVKDVGAERHFNTIDLKGHAPDAFEVAMSKVEGEIAPALGRIIETQSLEEEEDRIYLLNLIGLLHVRNPRMRELHANIAQTLARAQIEMALSSKEKWDDLVKGAKAAGHMAAELDADYDKLKASYKPEDYAVEVPVERHIISEMDTFDHVLNQLAERDWAIVKTPEGTKGLITSDHPVSVMFSEPKPGIRPGLSMRDTEVLFPVSRNLAVVGAYGIGKAVVATAGEEDVASLNGTTIIHSRRQIFAQDELFEYQIDQSKPPVPAELLLDDDRFKLKGDT